MATITVRALDPVTWEPQQGNGQANFLTDLAAVAQIIATRLRMFQGEWFLNQVDGLPMFKTPFGKDQILGSSGGPQSLGITINLISARIKSSPYVVAISSFDATYKARKFKYKAVVITQFGALIVGNTPATSAQISS